MLEGGQVDLGGHLAVLRRGVRCSLAVIGRFLRRNCGISVGGTRAGLPRYHPPWPRAYAARGPLIGVALPVLLVPPRGHGLSSGGSGVILHFALAPGLSPSPGRSWPLTTLLVPIHASRSAQCTGPREAWTDRFSGGRPYGPHAVPERPGPRSRTADVDPKVGGPVGPERPRGGLPGGGAGHNGWRLVLSRHEARADAAACPVAAGLVSIYRPSTIREQDHKM